MQTVFFGRLSAKPEVKRRLVRVNGETAGGYTRYLANVDDGILFVKAL